jgi:hypothetical protein
MKVGSAMTGTPAGRRLHNKEPTLGFLHGPIVCPARTKCPLSEIAQELLANTDDGNLLAPVIVESGGVTADLSSRCHSGLPGNSSRYLHT